MTSGPLNVSDDDREVWLALLAIHDIVKCCKNKDLNRKPEHKEDMLTRLTVRGELIKPRHASN